MENRNHANLFVFSGGNKAGMQGIDKERQAQIIYEASKNSEYFKRAAEQDQKAQAKAAIMAAAIKKMTSSQISHCKSSVNKRLVELELRRDLTSRICCVIDMDMFYAAVEIRDNPKLEELPVAVGGISMVSTANYVARTYGVRSAMPGFIAKKLCPHLVFVEPNFEKYEKVSNQVRQIIAEYDPNYQSFSLDEMYLDLKPAALKRLGYDIKDSTATATATEATLSSSIVPKPQTTKLSPTKPVQLAQSSSIHISEPSIFKLREVAFVILDEIRSRIRETTGGLTCSAGMANNFMLAKIGSDFNKPNGQYELPPVRETILDFVAKLPCRKVGGIGKVTENMLSSMNMKTMGDVRDNLHEILFVYTPAITQFLIRASLGIADDEGVDDVGPPEPRKSMGVERTFGTISEPDALREKLKHICELVAADLKSHDLFGLAITLKLKTTEFILYTRTAGLRKYSQSFNELYPTALRLLEAMMPISIRLMGVSVSKFKPTSQTSEPSGNLLSFFQQQPQSKRSTSNPISVTTGSPILAQATSLSAVAKGTSEPYNLDEEHSVGEELIEECSVRFQSQEDSEDENEEDCPDDIHLASAPPYLSGKLFNSGVKQNSASFFKPQPSRDDSSFSIMSTSAHECPICHKQIIGGYGVVNIHIQECLTGSQIVSKPSSKTSSTIDSFIHPKSINNSSTSSSLTLTSPTPTPVVSIASNEVSKKRRAETGTMSKGISKFFSSEVLTKKPFTGDVIVIDDDDDD